eukprot:CAMPEP_0177652816 /NCGR_PEP_ID=MMETSP0447-20121125/13351_1 /TAXON_ID=0 /ORGANISM="Stygamoeba regulata, Strain BSH-02190019" /LENGTH=584 /DNA_ID=CAMNT_0019156125 /DNA_START=150 /DNA_END=1904 /DNA_ORIENTATION=+
MADANEDNSLYPIQILIDELKNEEMQLRLNSMKRVGTIAKALGPERTRSELIPYLNDSVDDEDEVLSALAEELGKFVDLVGGPKFAHVVLDALESLCNAEEAVVRDKAVESITTVVACIDGDQFNQHFYPLLSRLAGGDWYTSRMSSCGLFPRVFPRCSAAQKGEIVDFLVNLSGDETPMVRRSASTHLGALAGLVELDQLKAKVIPTFTKLASDEQDSVRLLAVENCASIATRLEPAQILELVLPVVRECSLDKSWRVRYMVADNFSKLGEAVGSAITEQHLLQYFIALLKDVEAEVRTAASQKVAEVCKLLPLATVSSAILPCVRELVKDQSQHARAALATDIVNLAPLFGKEETIKQLLDLYLQLLKDEFPDVRLNIISKLEAVNSVIGVELLSKSLLPAIVELAEDKQWRVRLAIIEYIPLLAAQLGIQFFDTRLTNLCLSWLGDTVFSIRYAATQNLKRLFEVFGAEWSKDNIIPKVLALNRHPNYLYRITTLHAVEILAPVATPEILERCLIPLVVGLASDPVPNIRMNAAKTMAAMSAHVPAATLAGEFRPNLQKLCADADADVTYYAQKSLAALSG